MVRTRFIQNLKIARENTYTEQFWGAAVLITWSIVYWTYRPIEAALLCVIIGKQWWDDWDDI